MEAEVIKLNKKHHFDEARNDLITCECEDPRYTSLMDIMWSNISSTSHASNSERINHEFDSSTITIRNMLVKHAPLHIFNLPLFW